MTSVNTFFSKVYYINLARRPDRLAHVTQQLSLQGVLAERIEAIDGLSSSFSCVPSVDVDKKEVTLLSHTKISSFEAGLIATHKLILIDALKNNYDSILILEDDATLSPSFSEDFRRLTEDVPSDWDVVYLGALSLHNVSVRKKYSDTLDKAVYVLGCHAIGIHSKVFERLLSVSTFNKPIDVSYAEELQNINAFVSKNSLISQKEGLFSDLKFSVNQSRAFPF
jgi:GR25 family glycosyltransferase involved in LPS biosynthesis